MKTVNWHTVLRILVVTFVIAQFSTFIAPYAQAKPEKIYVGVIGDFSGPYAPVVGPTKAGAEDAWKYINNELGGVDGVKVIPLIADMAGKVDIGLSKYNEMVSMNPKPLFIDTFITPLAAALRERYIEDEIVGFHPGAYDTLYPVGLSYSYYAMYPELLAMGLKYLKDNHKGDSPLRVGILTWDTSYGRAIVIDQFYDYAKKIGVEIVDTQLFGIREIDVLTQLMKLKSKKIDHIITNCTASGPLTIKKGLKEMGWDIGVMNAAGGGWGTVRLAPELFENDLVVLPTRSFDEVDAPAIKTIMKYFKSNNRTKNEKSLFYLLAWQCAIMEYDILTKIVKEKGWDAVNAKAIDTVLRSGMEFSPLDMQTLKFTETRRTPPFARVYQVKSGKLLPMTDFLTVPDFQP